MLQGLVSLLRDLVLAGTAPDRLELTSVSPQFRQALPDLARSLGKARLLQWQAQLRGSEQQLRHSVNPRLWLEVLLLGLLAEPVAAAQPISAAAPAAAAPVVAPPIAPAVAPVAPPAAAPIPAPAPAPAPPVSVEPNSSANLPELWQQILAGLELPSTRMLLSQQARLVRLDERRAVVQVAGNWMAMVQSRLPLLETAVAKALGSPRQLTLEAGGESAAPTGAPSAAAARPAPPSPTPARLPIPAANQSPPALVTPTPSPPAEAAAPPMAAPLDEKARRLAEFFNGEVVELDGPLEGMTDGEADAAA